MDLRTCQRNDIIKYTYHEGKKKRVDYYLVVQSMGGYVIVIDKKGVKRNFQDNRSNYLQKVGWLERILHVPKSLKQRTNN